MEGNLDEFIPINTLRFLTITIVKFTSTVYLRDTTGTETYDSITTQYYRGGAVSASGIVNNSR